MEARTEPVLDIADLMHGQVLRDASYCEVLGDLWSLLELTSVTNCAHGGMLSK